MGHSGREVHTSHVNLDRAEGPEHLTSAQLLRRHAQDLIESAERLLAQAEAELETAYEMVSPGGGFGPTAAENGRS